MLDLSLALLRRGYLALPEIWASTGSDQTHVATRLLGRPAHVVRGPAGARLFYDETVVARTGALPAPLAHLLFGKGAVHGLDGDRHRARKALFVDALTPDRVAALGREVAAELEDAALSWCRREQVGLFDELVRVYGTCVVQWSGIAVEPHGAAKVARRSADVVDGFGFAPRAYARAWSARTLLDRWATARVREARAGDRRPAEGTMLHVLSTGPGRYLPAKVAGVELLNVIRPTVAVAWLGAFAALALVRAPDAGRVLGDPARRAERRFFADEVRRTAPFVPALAGRVVRTTIWRGQRIRRGQYLVLDVPATNRFGGTWGDPDLFRPSRFAEHDPDAFEHVPQGGGDVRRGHRCPGEEIALELLDRTLLQLARTGFTLAGGEADLTRIPTRPKGLAVRDAAPIDGAPSLRRSAG